MFPMLQAAVPCEDHLMTHHQTSDRLGPIDYQIIEFADGVVATAGFRTLLELVDAHRIQVLDLEFVTKAADGTVTMIAAHDVTVADGETIDLALFDGAASGIIGELDLDEISGDLTAGGVAAILVYEELTMLAVLDAWEASGATIVAAGPILPDDLLVALDAAEAN